jgi:hypothetical protein
MADKKRKPLGKPLPKIEDSFVEPSPTEEEVKGLLLLWDIYAPPEYKGLLIAKHTSVIKQTGENPGRFVYDDDLKCLVEVGTGRKISRNEVRLAYRKFVSNYANR